MGARSNKSTRRGDRRRRAAGNGHDARVAVPEIVDIRPSAPPLRNGTDQAEVVPDSTARSPAAIAASRRRPLASVPPTSERTSDAGVGNGSVEDTENAPKAAKKRGKAAKKKRSKAAKGDEAKAGKKKRNKAAKADEARRDDARRGGARAGNDRDAVERDGGTSAKKRGEAKKKRRRAEKRDTNELRNGAEATMQSDAVRRSDGDGRTGTGPVPDIDAYPADELRHDFLLACVSRAIDDREIALQKQSRVFFQISGAGHEALLLGLSHDLRPGYDWFFPYYRDLALMLGLGVTPEDVLRQAVGSADDPASGGRQMPSHWGDRERNVVTQSSPTGSQCLPAVGCAEAGRYIVRRPQLGLPAHGDEITYVSLGEGATSEGEFWESLNTACTEHLPVLFVVADNGYAISVPSSEQSPAPISDLVRGFAGLQVWSIDGTDYFEVRRTARAVVSHVRAGTGPALIHATVTRPYSHSAADTQSKYRLPGEMEREARNDPIDRLERVLVEGGVVTADEAAETRAEAKRIVTAAAKTALASPRPDVGTVLDNVVALPDIPDPGEAEAGPDGEDAVAMGEAIRRALHEAMEADERIRVFGEDVADAREAIMADVEGKGGVFGTTHGLQRSFGRARCYNTPLAEANIIGRAVGQAIRGLRPAPEIQFFDYIWPAMQQIRSEAATVRWRSNGVFTCPTVMRVPIGGYLQGGSIWHSQSGESIFAHIPGLLIAFPSRASDAAGLLRAAFRCEDPVLFLEHKHLLRQPYTRDPYPGPDHVIPFGKGRYVTRGDDLTIVTWGATVQRSLLAAERLAETDGASVEIIDLRTLVPWDREMVAESVAKTARLLVVHEDTVQGGFGGEIAAWAADQSFWNLDAPIGRVGAQECHVAYAPELEAAILPQPDDVVAAAHRLLRA